MAEPGTKPWRETFEGLWRQHQVILVRYCYGFTHDFAEAEGVCQEVGLRVWKHFSRLGGDYQLFGPWALAIARRECARWGKQRQTDRERQVSLSSEDLLPLEDPASHFEFVETGDLRAFLLSCLEEAATGGHLTVREGAVVKEGLTAGFENWASLGQRLGMKDNLALVTFNRAITKLRVFLFQYYPDTLGGLAVLRGAWAEARRKSSPALTEGESNVFERIILRSINLRSEDQNGPSGGKAALRAACRKIAKFLPSSVRN